MQKEPMKYHPFNGLPIGHTVCTKDAADYRSRILRAPYNEWRFNPWTGRERQLADIESDPYGILIHDGVSPILSAKQATGRPSRLLPRIAFQMPEIPVGADSVMQNLIHGPTIFLINLPDGLSKEQTIKCVEWAKRFNTMNLLVEVSPKPSWWDEYINQNKQE